MKANELKDELRKGKYIIAAFGKISLWKGTDRERTIHPNVFRALIKEDVLHEECIECGASEYTLKTRNEKEILQARVKELEVDLSKLKRSYDIMSAYAVHYVPEHKTQELIKDVNEAYK